MQLANLIKNLKLGPDAREELDRVLALPEVEAILSREEHKTIAHRRELMKKLAGVPGRHSKSIEIANRKLAEAHHLAEKLEAELIEAKAAHRMAGMLADGAKREQENEQAELVAELHAGRDRRLDDLYLALDKLADQARGLVRIWPQTYKSPLGSREVRYVGNSVEVEDARSSILAAQRKLEAFALGSMTRQEITDSMAEICANLVKPLDALDLVAPSIDESGAVTQPKVKTGVDLTSKRIEEAAA
ncbi:MAG: hypothetical protein K8F27_01875 [Sulfuricellaceae bacterium]|nr:hypothetical protein [Sulfuricellaceae bacterium]